MFSQSPLIFNEKAEIGIKIKDERKTHLIIQSFIQFFQILESSQTLLNVLKRESQSLKEKQTPAPGAPIQRNNLPSWFCWNYIFVFGCIVMKKQLWCLHIFKKKSTWSFSCNYDIFSIYLISTCFVTWYWHSAYVSTSKIELVSPCVTKCW